MENNDDLNKYDYQLPMLPEDTIVEAIFNVQARSSLAAPNGVKEALEKKYPNVSEIHRNSLSISSEKDGANGIQIEGSLLGYQVRVSDRQISNFQESGFSFHKLKPYGSFDDIIPSVLEQWLLHKELIKTQEITHLGLRMINEIHPKSSNIPFNEVFSLRPQYPAIDGIHPKSFTVQTRLAENQNENSTCDLLLTQRHHKGMAFYILDINCVIEVNKDLELSQIKMYFENLRSLKNRIYSGSFTKNYLELLKKG